MYIVGLVFVIKVKVYNEVFWGNGHPAIVGYIKIIITRHSFKDNRTLFFYLFSIAFKLFANEVFIGLLKGCHSMWPVVRPISCCFFSMDIKLLMMSCWRRWFLSLCLSSFSSCVCDVWHVVSSQTSWTLLEIELLG